MWVLVRPFVHLFIHSFTNTDWLHTVSLSKTQRRDRKKKKKKRRDRIKKMRFLPTRVTD